LRYLNSNIAVDRDGTVYADSEDGSLFVIKQDGTLNGQIFLQQAVGAAYTPVSIGLDGKIYTLNNGDMFVVGN
jgi:outer membrane protein assembly factor BamB